MYFSSVVQGTTKNTRIKPIMALHIISEIVKKGHVHCSHPTPNSTSGSHHNGHIDLVRAGTRWAPPTQPSVKERMMQTDKKNLYSEEKLEANLTINHPAYILEDQQGFLSFNITSITGLTCNLLYTSRDNSTSLFSPITAQVHSLTQGSVKSTQPQPMTKLPCRKMETSSSYSTFEPALQVIQFRFFYLKYFKTFPSFPRDQQAALTPITMTQMFADAEKSTFGTKLFLAPSPYSRSANG